MKFTTAEKNQIEKRFQTMYGLLTKKTWIQGHEALNKTGEEVEPTEKKATQFCLIGAVRHINGPTEEQIAALIAYQILTETGRLEEELVDWHPAEVPSKSLSGLDRVRAINGFFSPDNSYRVKDIIVEWNDDEGRTFAEVKAMLKRAAKLYDKLMPLGPIIRNLIEAEAAETRAVEAMNNLKLKV